MRKANLAAPDHSPEACGTAGMTASSAHPMEECCTSSGRSCGSYFADESAIAQGNELLPDPGVGKATLVEHGKQ